MASRVSSKLLLVVHVVCCAFHQVLGGCINKKVCVSDQIRVTEVSGLIASLYLSRRFTVFVASVFVASVFVAVTLFLSPLFLSPLFLSPLFLSPLR